MASIAEIQKRLKAASTGEFPALEAEFADDPRKGVRSALDSARRRIKRETREHERLIELYRFEREIANGRVAVGLDEVGRGPLAGPLTVGAVVLDPSANLVEGLNDSKQIPETKRPSVAEAAKRAALARAVVHIPAHDIDEQGIMACLKRAFRIALEQVEAELKEKGVEVEVVLLDGNPLGIDPREVNVVKGDGRCASIAAASVIAKVERDALMVAYDAEYPGYDLAHSKGYGSAAHRAAIADRGLTPIHRVSYCSNFFQPTLFS